MSLLRNMEGRLRRKQPAVRLPKIELPPFGKDYVKGLVYAEDDKIDDSRSSPDDPYRDYVHVSSLLKFCARRHVLAIKDEVNLVRQPKGQDRVLWAMGKAAEHHIRTQIINHYNYEGIVGRWSCPCRQLSYAGFHDKLRVCSRCKSFATVYNEFTLTDEEYKIVGNPDLNFFPDKLLTVLEAKSMKKDQFNELESPLPDHIFQVGAYHRMWVRRGTVEVRDESVIIYVVKEWGYRGSPYKEFHINTTKEPWNGILDIAWANAAQAKKALLTKQLPPRIAACPNCNTTTAKNCPCVVNCFSRS